MFQRLTALVLALFVASPTCWCCGKEAPAKTPVKRHACCEKSAAEESPSTTSSDQKKDPCPCSFSQTKREQQPVQTAVPAASWTLAAIVPSFQDQPLPVCVHDRAGMPGIPLNTGPPDTRPPLYKRYSALLN